MARIQRVIIVENDDEYVPDRIMEHNIQDQPVDQDMLFDVPNVNDEEYAPLSPPVEDGVINGEHELIRQILHDRQMHDILDVPRNNGQFANAPTPPPPPPSPPPFGIDGEEVEGIFGLDGPDDAEIAIQVNDMNRIERRDQYRYAPYSPDETPSSSNSPVYGEEEELDFWPNIPNEVVDQRMAEGDFISGEINDLTLGPSKPEFAEKDASRKRKMGEDDQKSVKRIHFSDAKNNNENAPTSSCKLPSNHKEHRHFSDDEDEMGPSRSYSCSSSYTAR